MENINIGEIKTDQKTFLQIGCATGSILIKEIQPEGKRKMSIDEFLRGKNLDGASFV